MPTIKTPQDLGHAIRSRRKELRWDQATLARQVGVTRQWVIDIEKGKPRAELELALRALHALGLTLSADNRSTREGPQDFKEVSATQSRFNINRIVENNKSQSSSSLADYLLNQSRPKTASEYLKLQASDFYKQYQENATSKPRKIRAADLYNLAKPQTASASELLKRQAAADNLRQKPKNASALLKSQAVDLRQESKSKTSVQRPVDSSFANLLKQSKPKNAR